MIFCIVVVVILLLIGGYNLLIAILGLFPKFKDTTVGTLQKKRTQRNVRIRGGSVPVVTDYTYQYTVNGKKYKYSSSGRFTKSHLHQKVTMVYLKLFPRYAYPERFTPITQWICGVGMLLLGVMFIIGIFFEYLK